MATGPKVLFADIETAPIVAHVWALFDQNVGLNQIQSDWHLLSWSAKWADSDKVMYADQRNAKRIEDDKMLLKGIWELLDEADIVIWQNGRNFDHKKLNARFILQGFRRPSPYKQIDTLEIAKRQFGFTSNKLEYMSDKLCTKYKKLKHKKYPGHELWTECLAGNLDAWKEMEKYNRHDVLALEELYGKLQPWDTSVNFSIYHADNTPRCNCGSTDLQRRGFSYTGVGKYQRFQCQKCGAWMRGAELLNTKAKRASLPRTGTVK